MSPQPLFSVSAGGGAAHSPAEGPGHDPRPARHREDPHPGGDHQAGAQGRGQGALLRRQQHRRG